MDQQEPPLFRKISKNIQILTEPKNNKSNKKCLASLTHNKPEKYKLILMRHGQCEWDEKNKFTGWYDSKLTTKGRMEATAAGKLLKKHDIEFDVAFTSVLTRCVETARLLLREIGCSDIPVHMSWRLNERHTGALTGLSKSRVTQEYGMEKVSIWKRDYNIVLPVMPNDHPYFNTIIKDTKYLREPKRFPTTESLKLAMLRIMPYWKNVIAPCILDGKKVLIVGHDNTLRGLVKYLCNLTDENIMSVHLPMAIPFSFELGKDLKVIGDKCVRKIHYYAEEKDVNAAFDYLHYQALRLN